MASLNKRTIGIGLAQNKKQAKYLAAAQAIKNISPQLYQEWKVKYKDGIGAHQPNEESKTVPQSI